MATIKAIEQKAQRYDEALEKLRDFYRDYDTVSCLIDIKEELENIFPELKESEDEKIRKKLYESIRINNSREVADKYIAWLEKQGEQKPADKVEPKFKVGDIVKHKKNPHLTYILKRFTDDGDYEFHAIGKDGNEGETCFAVVEYQDDWELVEPHSSWSEQDESRLAHILRLLDVKDDKKYLLMFGLNSLQDLEKDINWLKSLKERVQPQTMQEWSEEDKKLINDTCHLINTLASGYGEKVTEPITLSGTQMIASIKDRLSALVDNRHQSAWKPSEEMLEALYRVIPENVMEKSEDEILLDKLYQGLKYGRVLIKN